MSGPAPPLLLVAKISRAHGLRGEVGVVVVGDDPGRLAAGRELWFEKTGETARTLRIAARRGAPGRTLLRFEGVTSREEAEPLAGGELSVPFDPAEVGPDEFYAHQLEGLRVVTTGGVEVGRVVGVVFAPGRDFLEISAGGRPDRMLVPFHGDIVKEVDLGERRVTIDPPEGLLEL